ncbi:DUF7220 family protein, partial [Meridianimarinicoccus sp. RP-17]
MSLVEAIANVAVGYGVAVVTQILIFPVFGLHTTLAQNLKMGAVFTVVSIARSFALRRLFEAIRIRESKSLNAGMKVTPARPVKYTRFQRKDPMFVSGWPVSVVLCRGLPVRHGAEPHTRGDEPWERIQHLS